KKHLCAAQIGTKNGNLSIEDAISGWVRGIKAAITGTDEAEQRHLTRVSFVAHDPRKIAGYQDAILNEQKKMGIRGRLRIEYTPLSDERLEELQQEGLRREHDEFHGVQGRRSAASKPAPPTPTRVTLGLDRKALRYGAITEESSIPERTVPIDP